MLTVLLQSCWANTRVELCIGWEWMITIRQLVNVRKSGPKLLYPNSIRDELDKTCRSDPIQSEIIRQKSTKIYAFRLRGRWNVSSSWGNANVGTKYSSTVHTIQSEYSFHVVFLVWQWLFVVVFRHKSRSQTLYRLISVCIRKFTLLQIAFNLDRPQIVINYIGVINYHMGNIYIYI